MAFDNNKYPCPCCGYLVFERMPGSHDVCPICLWEDNLVQLRFPLMPGGANCVSLKRGQQNFQNYGSAEKRNLAMAREPFAEERQELAWRPLDVAHDNVEEPQRGIKYGDTYPDQDTSVLYYWRETYWRRFAS